MIRYLIDSDCAIFATTGQHPQLRIHLADCAPGDVALSAVSFAEITLGMAQGKPPSQEALDIFVKFVPVVAFDMNAAVAYSRLPFKRARFDRLLAAHALSLDAIVITNNEADFADVPGLRIENWTV